MSWRGRYDGTGAEGGRTHQRQRSSHRSSGSSRRATQRSSNQCDTHRTVKSDNLDELDPLALFCGDGGGALRHSHATSCEDDSTWRVRLPVWGGGNGSGGGGGAPQAAARTALRSPQVAPVATVEFLGGSQDIADLLAAVACKHWVGGAMLLRNDGT